MSNDWHPDQYLKFKTYREMAIQDLIAKITIDNPKTIVDLGCGTGNSTIYLKQRWPEANIKGIDSSEAMLAKAIDPDITWLQADLSSWEPREKFDLIFSNAAIHWCHDHDKLLPKLLTFLKPGGVLAVQMPNNFDKPTHTTIFETAKRHAWFSKLKDTLRNYTIMSPRAYYDILRPHVKNLNQWETTYFHPLEGTDPVYEWTKGSVLRPYLDALDDSEMKEFEREIKNKFNEAYPAQSDSVTIMPFHRLFFVASV